MAILRSAQLAVHEVQTAHALETAFTCPAGYRAILRDIRVSDWTGNGPALNFLRFISSGGSLPCDIWRSGLAVGATFGESCSIVLEEGDELAVYSGNSGTTFVLSGALLPL